MPGDIPGSWGDPIGYRPENGRNQEPQGPAGQTGRPQLNWMQQLSGLDPSGARGLQFVFQVLKDRETFADTLGK